MHKISLFKKRESSHALRGAIRQTNGTEEIERLYFIGRIEDVRVIYESSTLDENIELLNHQATVEETAARWFTADKQGVVLLKIITNFYNNTIEVTGRPAKYRNFRGAN